MKTSGSDSRPGQTTVRLLALIATLALDTTDTWDLCVPATDSSSGTSQPMISKQTGRKVGTHLPNTSASELTDFPSGV